MREFRTTLTQRGQVTLPAEVRRLLGVKPRDKVSFTIEDGEVKVSVPRFTLESALGSVRPLPTAATSIEQQIAQAKEERAELRMRKWRGE